MVGNLIQYLIIAALFFYPNWRIFKRSGLNPAFSILLFIPVIGGLIVLIILAFADWPLIKERGI